ncbi:3-oxoacyl-synthase 2 [Globomyces pollinis-pini]|nr:3-oxoacyl-synthase 2 [Globomyces pollinis-pini]
MRRVVVTGLGLLTPLGSNVKQNWINLINGVSGIHKVPDKNYIAGCVPAHALPFSKSDDKKLSLFMKYALVAAHEAITDSGWSPNSDYDKEMTGVCIGSGIGSLQDIVEAQHALIDKGPRKVNPYFVPRLLVNMAAGHVSMKYGYKGPNHAVSTACTTGAHSIGDASRFIQYGDANVMIAGGSEASVTDLAIAGFSQLRALSTNFNDTPEKASRPFDIDRDGFVMGEGAGVVVLEEYQHAVNRGAKIYAELVGYGLTGDSYHMTAPPEDGSGAIRAMKRALAIAKLDPIEVDYVNAHATSTPLGDRVEANAISKTLGKQIAVSSTKGATGHLLGAAGSVEAIFTILSINKNIIPGTVNLSNPDMTDLPIDLVQQARDVSQITRRSGNGTGVTVALTNSFGFGGTNASLCFSKIQ